MILVFVGKGLVSALWREWYSRGFPAQGRADSRACDGRGADDLPCTACEARDGLRGGGDVTERLDWESEFVRENHRLSSGWRSGEIDAATAVYGLAALKREARLRGIPFRVASDVLAELRRNVLSGAGGKPDGPDEEDLLSEPLVYPSPLYARLGRREAEGVLAVGWTPAGGGVLRLHASAREAAADLQHLPDAVTLAAESVPVSALLTEGRDGSMNPATFSDVSGGDRTMFLFCHLPETHFMMLHETYAAEAEAGDAWLTPDMENSEDSRAWESRLSEGGPER